MNVLINISIYLDFSVHINPSFIPLIKFISNLLCALLVLHESIAFGLPIGSSKTIPGCCKLPIVIIEVKVVHRMT